MPSLTRLRSVSWVIVFELLMLGRDRWGRLDPRERKRLSALVAGVTKQRRVPTRAEREFLRSVAGKLDLIGAGRQMVPRVTGRKKRA